MYYFIICTQLRRERFLTELEGYAKQMEEFETFGDLQEVRRYMKKAQALNSKLEDAQAKVQQIGRICGCGQQLLYYLNHYTYMYIYTIHVQCVYCTCTCTMCVMYMYMYCTHYFCIQMCVIIYYYMYVCVLTNEHISTIVTPFVSSYI